MHDGQVWFDRSSPAGGSTVATATERRPSAFLEGLGFRAQYWVSSHLTTVRPRHPLNVFFLP
jgi:hypothetical protein